MPPLPVDTARSSAAWAGLDTPLWQGVLDEKARLLDLRDVSFRRGRLVLHALEAEVEADLRRRMQPYKHFVGGEQLEDRLEDVVELSREPLRWAECERVEERAAFLLSPWHPDNAYHLHCDNLLPMFANVRQAGALEGPRVLYLFEGDRRRNARAVQLREVLDRLFDGAVRPFAELAAARRPVGFRRLRWGRGPLPLYLENPLARELPPGAAPPPGTHPAVAAWAGVGLAYQRWALARYGVREREAAPPGAAPRLLFMARPDGARRLADADVLARALREEHGLDLRIFSDWKGISAAGLIELAHSADVLIAVHGAALAHMAYLPAGSLVVELKGESHLEIRVYPEMAKHFLHAHLVIDVSGGGGGPEGIVLGRARAVEVAGKVVAAWRGRQTASV